MTKQYALDYIREHLTMLHANTNIYEDGTCNLIWALENLVIPMLERDIEQDRLIEGIFDKDPHAFDRVNVLFGRENYTLYNEGLNNTRPSQRKENFHAKRNCVSRLYSRLGI